MAIPWIMISIGILIVLLGVITIVAAKYSKKKHKPDYYVFFIMGVIWTGFGLVLWEDMSFFFVIGIVFMIIGLANRDKWKKNHRTWKQLSKSEKKLKISIIIIMSILVLAGLVAFLLVEKGILG